MVDRLAQAQVGWRAAEERLYPLAMVDPAGYQQVIGLVGALLKVLRAGIERSGQLLELADSPESLLSCLPAQRPGIVPDATLLGAAFAVRARELAAAEEAARRSALIAAARAQGRDWVCLDGPAELVELIEGNRVELHLASGTGVIAGVDPWSGEDPFLLEAVPSDVGGQRRVERFRDRARWLAEHDRWRAEIERIGEIAALTTEPGTVSDSG